MPKDPGVAVADATTPVAVFTLVTTVGTPPATDVVKSTTVVSGEPAAVLEVDDVSLVLVLVPLRMAATKVRLLLLLLLLKKAGLSVGTGERLVRATVGGGACEAKAFSTAEAARIDGVARRTRRRERMLG